MKKLVILAVVFLGFASTSFAQTAGADASILTSVSIAKDNNLNFGSIYSSVLGGSVVILPEAFSASTTRTASGLTLGSVNGAAGQFTITGSGSTTGAKVTLTTTGITLTGPGAPMTLSLLNASSNGAAIVSGTTAITLDPTTGTAKVYFGGTLAVGPRQVAGTYTNSNVVSVTVNY